MLDEEARQHVAPRDLHLLLDGVAGDADDLHPVAQRRRDVEQVVRRADEEGAAEVERQVQVVIHELVVLARVEHLQHRGSGVAGWAPTGHLVNFVDHQHRVADLHSAQRLEEQPGHRTHVGATMTADLRLVADAAHGDAIELAPDRRGNGLAEGCLARTRWPDKTQDGPVRITATQLAHGEVLDDAFLRLAEPVMPAVECLLDLLQRDLLVAAVEVPGQRENPVEVSADDLVFARRAAELAEPFRFPPRLLADTLGELGRVDLAQQLDGFLFARVGLAEFRLDGAQLLPQVELALVLLDLDLGLPLHVFHHPRTCHFALEPVQDETQPLPDIEALEHLVLVADAEIHVGRGQVGEATRVRDIHLQDRRHFIRNPVHQLGQRLGRRDHARDEVIEIGGVGGRLPGRANGCDRVRFLPVDPLDHDPAQALERDLHRIAGQVDPLVHARRHADPADEPLGVDGVVMIPAGDHERHDEAGLVIGAEQREILRRAHLHGDGAERIHDSGSKRHERERRRELALENLVFSLWSGHWRQGSITAGTVASEPFNGRAYLKREHGAKAMSVSNR